MESKNIKGIENKPPLGIQPRKLWLEERFNEIAKAIGRYAEANIRIPSDWIRELQELRSSIIQCLPENKILNEECDGI